MTDRKTSVRTKIVFLAGPADGRTLALPHPLRFGEHVNIPVVGATYQHSYYYIGRGQAIYRGKLTQ